jgi:hypothetical protein
MTAIIRSPDLNAVVQGLTTGVAASIFFAFIGSTRNWCRDLKFRWQMKRAFRRIGVGSGIDGISLSIHNPLGKSFTVRRLILTTSSTNFVLIPTEEVNSTFKGQGPKFTKKQGSCLD